jgi:hypothetical protein
VIPNFKFRWKKTSDIFILNQENQIIKETSIQEVHNIFLKQIYHKYNGTEPNIKEIQVLIFNPHNLISQTFLKKNIFKEAKKKHKFQNRITTYSSTKKI